MSLFALQHEHRGNQSIRSGETLMDANAVRHREQQLEVLTTTRCETVPEGPSGGEAALTWLPRRLPAFLVATDLVAVLATVIAGWVIAPQSLASMAMLSPALILAHAALGIYRSRLVLSLLDDVPRLLSGWLVASAVAVYVPGLTGFEVRGNWVSLSLGVVFLLGARSASYVTVRHLRRTGSVAHRTLIIGATESGQRLVNMLSRRPEFGLDPIGYLRKQDYPETGLNLPVLGNVEELQEAIRACSISVAVLALENVPDAELVGLLRSCHRMRCELFVIPQFAEFHGINEDTELLAGIPLVRLRRAAHRTLGWRAKRILDVTISALALLALLPALVAIAAAVRIEGGSGVIFRQTRVGIDGREFALMKFRSMRPVNDDESATQWNIAQDSRVGPVGRVLRVSSLDELPQLLNIFRGDMSLVGPRPERPHFVREFSSLYPSYQARDRVPCGLTGWAQVHGLRGDTPIDERADFDNFYIEHWSLWLDVKILLRTFVSVFKSPGA